MATKSNALVAALSLAQSGKSYPVMDLVQQNPEIAAAISKLVSPIQNKPTYGNSGERKFPQPNVFQMRQLSNNVANNASDAETVMQILPDMELSAQILVSSILSPKDMLTTTLHFKPPEGLLPQQVTAQMIQKIDRHFDSGYRIKPELPRILREVLFETGSHIRAVLPENSVDELINRSLAIKVEDLSELIDSSGRVRSSGILGSPKKQNTISPSGISMEAFKPFSVPTALSENDHKLHLSGEYYSFKVGNNADSAFKENERIRFEEVVDNNVTVTDNISVLKIPALNRRIESDRINSALPNLNLVQSMIREQGGKVAMEARQNKKLSDKELSAVTYRQAQTGYEPVMVARTQSQLPRRTIGDPLVLDLPSESVIPVHVPGQQDKHVGYFVMLDAVGNPISRKNHKDYYAEMSQRMSSGNANGNSFASQLTNRVQRLMGGFDCTNNEHLDYSARVYADMVEQDLLARLRNGLYSNGAALARNEEVYRIMLARTLSSKHTQLLFLPVEMVTYFAFRYNGDGIGRSLLDDMKVLNSLRAMMTFANVMAGVRNSIGMTDLKFRLDPDDGDPLKSIEMMLNEIIRVKSQSFPLGVNSPVDLVKYLQRAAYTFTYENHPGLPDMSVEQSERNTNYVKPDTELEENLRKRAIMATGLNPETVDASFNGEFATSLVNNNLLLSRRVMQLQEQFCPQLADHLRKYAMATESLIQDLKQILDSNFDEIKLDESEIEAIFGKDNLKNKALIVPYLLDRFMRGVTVELPRPNTVTVESQTQMLQNFIGLLDIGIEAWFSDEFMTENLVGQLGNQAGEFKKLLRAYFIRQYMAENNILPELSTLIARDDNGKPDLGVWDENSTFLKGLLGPLSVMSKKINDIKKASDTISAANGGDSSSDNQTDSEQTSSNANASGSDDGLGGDIPGLDDAGLDSSSQENPKPEGGDTAGDQPVEPQ